MVLLDEGVQTSAEIERKYERKRFVEEGIKMWKEKQEQARIKRMKEQAEMKEMLGKFWPWGSHQPKPRGLRDLRLEGIFPEHDFQQAKRHTGVLDLGRPGCGAPMITNTGRKVTRKREDPILRFQWGGDLRKYVDNDLRYKAQRIEQENYRKELDKLLEEKKLRQLTEKESQLEFERKQSIKSPPWGKPGPGGRSWRHPRSVGLNFLKSLGWSNENTLRKLEEERARYKERMRKEYEKFKSMKITKPNQIVKLEPIIRPSNVKAGAKEVAFKNQEAECNNNVTNSEESAVELVPLLAKHRALHPRIFLGSTDVTKGVVGELKVRPDGPAYLQELSNQMSYKRNKTKEIKQQEVENVLRHFSTWDNFWGRPGHGAPLPVIKKKRLDHMLYCPNLIPVSVA